MSEEIISVRIDKESREKMRLHEHINWSAIIRKAIKQQLEKENVIDVELARRASRDIDKLREAGAFSKGKTGTEIIREWRNKRRF